MKHTFFLFVCGIAACFFAGCSDQAGSSSGGPHVLFLAGDNSHGWGSHKHVAGTIILSEALPQGAPGVSSEMIREWPSAEQLERADALVIYADGWGKHPANDHLDELKAFMDQGKGLVVLHWATGIGLSLSGSGRAECESKPDRRNFSQG